MGHTADELLQALSHHWREKAAAEKTLDAFRVQFNDICESFDKLRINTSGKLVNGGGRLIMIPDPEEFCATLVAIQENDAAIRRVQGHLAEVAPDVVFSRRNPGGRDSA